jgi:predicted flap endonuclease-1-like 5' DNA nuclease
MSALFCGSWWPYLLAFLIGLATAWWAWGSRRSAASDDGLAYEPVAKAKAAPEPVVKSVAPAVKVAVPVAAAAGAAALMATPVKKAVPKKKPAPVKKAAPKATAPKAVAKPAVKAAAKPVVKPAAKAAVKPVAKKAAVKVAAKPAVKKVVVKPTATPKVKAVAAPKAKPVKFKAVPAPKRKPAAQPKAAAKPKAAPKPKTVKPVIPDNLELLKGVGPKLNALLKSLGVTSFEQVANWSARDIREIDSKLGTFAGRIGRDNWVDQAKLLSKGDIAAFERKYGELGSEIK